MCAISSNVPAACQPAGLTANCQSTHAHRYEGLTGRGRLCSPTKKFLAVVSVKAVRLEEVMLSLQAVQPEKSVGITIVGSMQRT